MINWIDAQNFIAPWSPLIFTVFRKKVYPLTSDLWQFSIDFQNYFTGTLLCYGCYSDWGPAASGGQTVLANNRNRNGGRLRLIASRLLYSLNLWRGIFVQLLDIIANLFTGCLSCVKWDSIYTLVCLLSRLVLDKVRYYHRYYSMFRPTWMIWQISMQFSWA